VTPPVVWLALQMSTPVAQALAGDETFILIHDSSSVESHLTERGNQRVDIVVVEAEELPDLGSDAAELIAAFLHAVDQRVMSESGIPGFMRRVRIRGSALRADRVDGPVAGDSGMTAQELPNKGGGQLRCWDLLRDPLVGTVAHRRFSLARRTTSAVVSSSTGGRPGDRCG
jgi:hypothetical protein